MMYRSILVATALLAGSAAAVFAQSREDVLASPTLRANITVNSDVVRIGDVIDNAGPAAQIAIYRAPDLGTTGKLPVAQIIAALRARQVIGVDTRNLREITVTRLARNVDAKDIETQVALALEHRGGLGDAANLTLTFDRDLQGMQLDVSNSGAMQPTSTRFDPRSGRFDVSFEIGNDANSTPVKLRFTGTAVETLEVAVLARGVERNEVLKSSDVLVERRPKAEVGNDPASRDRAVGMQARRQLRLGQALRTADLNKPDLVVRDQAVTLVYESAGLYLTIRGKSLDNGTEGDVVNVMNLQSKRTVSGVVTGRGQVSVTAPAPRLAPTPEAAAPSNTAVSRNNTDSPATTNTAEAAAPVSVAAVDSASPSLGKAE
jgi:flagella basal body P-ring formation protein FlgA